MFHGIEVLKHVRTCREILHFKFELDHSRLLSEFDGKHITNKCSTRVALRLKSATRTRLEQRSIYMTVRQRINEEKWTLV